MKKSAQRRLRAGAVLVLLLWAASSWGYATMIESFGDGMFAAMLWVLVVLFAGLSTVMILCFIPIYIIMGGMKLRDQRREEIEALGDENVVHADPDGERKLHQYLTAMTSMEARIGMIQQPDPWIPRDRRPPEDARGNPLRMSPQGRRIFFAILFAGVVIGLIAALAHDGGGDSVIRLVATGAAGGVLALPLAAVFALMLGKLEHADDARGSRSETA